MYRVLLFLILLTGCSSPTPSKKCTHFPNRIVCNFETVDNNTFKSNSKYYFENIGTQSEEHPFDGKYSCKIDSNNIYGATIKLPVKAGDILKIRIKRFSPSKSALVLSISGGKHLMSKEGKKVDDNWEELEINTTVYSKVEQPIATIYSYYNKRDANPSYFDNLEIEIFRRDDTISHPRLNNSISITIEPNEFQKIKKSRAKAFETGIIEDKLKFWVPATVNYNGDVFKGKYKIKGDWTEHLETDKWGAKLKLNKPLFEAKKFSIMKPNSRSGLREILFHEVLKEHKILTTNYRLNGIILNGINKGYFAVEEHFSKQYLKSRLLPIGAILKIEEKKLWKDRNENYYSNMFTNESKMNFHLIENIKNYVKSDSINDRKAIQLLEGFRNSSTQLDSVFDIDYLTSFYALANVFGAHHSLIWHNMRFYYNPEKRKLYPIGYDAYSHKNFLIRYGFIGDKPQDSSAGWSSLFLNNSTFLKLYKQKLRKFSSNDFIDNSIKNHQPVLKIALNKIQLENCSYSEDFEFVYKNAKLILNTLDKK
jgi:hypothetical protein